MDEQKAELIARSDGWTRAIERRDEDAAADHLDDDYALVLVQPSVSTIGRERWLDTLAEYHVHEWVVEERTVDIDGDLGVMLQRVRMRATVSGSDRSGIFVLTDIWRRRGDSWLVWRRHSTPLSAGSFPALVS